MRWWNAGGSRGPRRARHAVQPPGKDHPSRFSGACPFWRTARRLFADGNGFFLARLAPIDPISRTFVRG